MAKRTLGKALERFTPRMQIKILIPVTIAEFSRTAAADQVRIKIVEGPLAGHEIFLPKGTRVKK